MLGGILSLICNLALISMFATIVAISLSFHGWHERQQLPCKVIEVPRWSILSLTAGYKLPLPNGMYASPSWVRPSLLGPLHVGTVNGRQGGAFQYREVPMTG